MNQIDATHQIVENIYTSEQMYDTNEMHLAQLVGIPLPIGFVLHKHHADILANIAAQKPETLFNYQNKNNALLLSFSEDVLPKESLDIIAQKNQTCFTAQGKGNNKEIFLLFQKLLAQNGWNITYEHCNQIGIIKAKKAFQKVHVIIRAHDLYKDQSILHYIIQ